MVVSDDVKVLVADGMDRVPRAAQFLGVSKSMMYRMMDNGQLAYVKLGKARLIPRKALVELAARNLVQR